MTKFALSLPIFGLVLFAGCGSETKDSADTAAEPGPGPTTPTNEAYTGPTLIEAAGFSCTDSNMILMTETIGWTGSGTFNLWETGNAMGWDEEHPIASVDYDPNMWWDHLETTLASSAAVADFVAGTNTVFQCGVHDIDPVMTAMTRVTDTTGALADCWLFGSDPDGVAVVQGGGGPAYNTVSNPGDIDTCTVYTR